MQSYGSAAYVLLPLSVLIVFGVLVLVLKWAFGKKSSLVAALPRSGAPNEYGLLVPIARPETYLDAQRICATLEERGIKSSIAKTTEGLRVMVWPDDERAARAAVKGHA